MKTILLADIGGTNIRFAIYQNKKLSKVVKFKSIDFERPEQAFDLFISTLKNTPTDMILAAAGPVDKGTVHFTNRPWVIQEKVFIKRYHLNSCQLVNDFVVKGYGVLSMPRKDVVPLCSYKPDKKGPICVIGPGTGLGVCFLTYENDKWTAHPSEAGHSDLAATNPTQHKILAYLRPDGSHISAEEILSGRGLVALYQAVNALQGKTAGWVAPEEIAELAAKQDPMALQTYKHFIDFLASFAGNMAITLKTTGGVYLTSSILRHDDILNLFLKYPFCPVFQERGLMKQLAQTIPVFFITRSQSAFLGLKKLAEILEKSDK